MKIKIIKAGKPTYWYADSVGATLEVVDRHKEDYTLAEDYLLGEDAVWRHIAKDDCVILNEGSVNGGKSLQGE